MHRDNQRSAPLFCHAGGPAALLLLVLMFSGRLYADEPTQPASERELAAALLQQQGRLQIRLPDGTTQDIQATDKLPDGDWRLTQIDLWGRRTVNDATLQGLATADQLTHLTLSYTNITSAVAKDIAKLPRLTHLYLAGTAVDTEAAAMLLALPGLQSIDLSSTTVTDEAWTALPADSALQSAFLARTKVTAATLQALGRCEELRSLHLGGVEIAAADCVELAKLTGLEELSLRLPSAALQQLSALKNLQRLTLQTDRCTPTDVAGWAVAWPQLQRFTLRDAVINKATARQLQTAFAKAELSLPAPVTFSLFRTPADAKSVARWTPSTAPAAWPGLIPRPAELPGVPVWQIETIVPRSEIKVLAWHPEGQQIACGTGAGLVRIYDTETLNLVQILPAFKEPVTALAWRPQGDWLVTACESGQIKWLAPDGTAGPVLKIPDAKVYELAWKPDGSVLAVGGQNGHLSLWSNDAKPVQTLKAGQGTVVALGWRPDGQQLVSGSTSNGLHLWNADTDGKTLATDSVKVPGHRNRVTDVVFRSDGKQFVSCSWDNTVRLWSSDGRMTQIIESHPGRVDAIDISTGTNLLATICKANVRVGDPSTFANKTSTKTIFHNQSPLTSVKFSPDGATFATASAPDSRLRLFSVATGKLLRDVGGTLGAAPVSVDWHPGGSQLATGGLDRTARTWGSDGQPGHVMSGHIRPVKCVRFHPNGRRLASAGDKLIWLWTNDGLPAGSLNGHTSGVPQIDWTEHGDRLLSISNDNTGRIWPAADNWSSGDAWLPGKADDNVKIPLGKSGAACQWNATGTEAVFGLGDGQISRYDEDGSLHPVRKLKSGVNVVTRLKGSDLWFAGGWSNNLRFGRGLESQLANNLAMGNGVLSAHADPRTQRLAVGTQHRGLLVYAISDGKVNPPPVHQMADHGGRVKSVRWHPRGTQLATTGWDSTLRVYSADDFSPLWVACPLAGNEAIVFDAGGQVLSGTPALLDEHMLILTPDSQGRPQLQKPSDFTAQLRAAEEEESPDP